MPFNKWISGVLLSFLVAGSTLAAGRPSENDGVAVRFATNPLHDATLLLDGEALARLTWNDDAPAYPGDLPGSLTARYDSNMEPGRVGWALPEDWTQDDPFTAVAVFVIEPEGFVADPFGFFQISWGLWNSQTTGMERTGTLSNFAGDTFELVEFDYFPNVSPFFGGPYLSPAVFGVADRDHPLFDLLGSFANLSFGSLPLDLPLGVPLAAVIENRPEENAVVFSVQRVTESGGMLPLPGGVTVLPRSLLSVDGFSLDTVGLTLWRDGFAGESPSLRADVTFHSIVARPVRAVGAESVGGAGVAGN